MDKEYLQELLEKHTKGTLTEQEFEELSNHLKRSDADDSVYSFMDNYWNSQTQKDFKPFDDLQSQRVYQNITDKIDFRKKTTQTKLLPGIGRLNIAASFLIFSLLFISGYHFYRNKKKTATFFTEFHTNAGQMISKKLPDGSLIWLNANSSIKYDDNFNETTREVFLIGEAYFDIAHNPDKPFIVHAKTIKTKVLGTAFDINAYDKDQIKVMVARGKVSVADGDTQLALLTKSKQLSYNSQTKFIEKSDFNAALASSWVSGELVFNHVNLKEAATIIANWYNVRIVFSDKKTDDEKFVISFKNTVKLTQVLDMLGKLNHFTYTIKNNEITINNNNKTK